LAEGYRNGLDTTGRRPDGLNGGEAVNHWFWGLSAGSESAMSLKQACDHIVCSSECDLRRSACRDVHDNVPTFVGPSLMRPDVRLRALAEAIKSEKPFSMIA